MHYNGVNSYLFVNGTKTIKFEVKDSEIVAYPLRLGNISKYVFVDNMKETGLKGYFYDFIVNYNVIIMLSQVFNEKELDSIKCFDLQSKCLFQQ